MWRASGAGSCPAAWAASVRARIKPPPSLAAARAGRFVRTVGPFSWPRQPGLMRISGEVGSANPAARDPTRSGRPAAYPKLFGLARQAGGPTDVAGGDPDFS